MHQLQVYLEDACLPKWGGFDDRLRLTSMDKIRLAVSAITNTITVFTFVKLTQCMKNIFEPFMWSVEHSKNGDFSEHIIIV